MILIKKIKLGLYFLKQWLISIFMYPKMISSQKSYDEYWENRNISKKTGLNSFQKKRADLALEFLEPDSTILDIGCGSGNVLIYINEKKPMKRLLGIDISTKALEIARQKGIEAESFDIADKNNFKKMPSADYIFLFEIIEHLQDSEEIIKWAVINAKKGIFFSVPNTGFFTHRFRLLFGRFPLQWRVYPSEHLRFWTLRDMKWWLGELGYKFFKLYIYEGVPLFNKLWSSLFGQGLFIYIPKR